MIVRSERNVGLIYKFVKKDETRFSCLSFKKLGKTRSGTMGDGKITSLTHPDENHHSECHPVAQALVDAEDIDRTMRDEIRRTGRARIKRFVSLNCVIL